MPDYTVIIEEEVTATTVTIEETVTDIILGEEVLQETVVIVDNMQGPQGIQGVTGPANSLSIGTVATGPTAAASITGTAPTQTLSLTLPIGPTGPTGATGSDGIVAQVSAPADTNILWLDTDEPAATVATISVTAPITNTGTSTAAVIGLSSLISFTTLATGATAMGLVDGETVQVTPNASATYTTTSATAGSTARLIILTSGTTSRTITFGTGFKTTGTLTTGTTSARYFVFEFVSDGTNWIEMSRTVAIA